MSVAQLQGTHLVLSVTGCAVFGQWKNMHRSKIRGDQKKQVTVTLLPSFSFYLQRDYKMIQKRER